MTTDILTRADVAQIERALLEIQELQAKLDEADRAIARCEVLTMEARKQLEIASIKE